MTQNTPRSGGCDGSVPMQPGGAERTPLPHLPPAVDRDDTTPADQLQFLRHGVDPLRWCPRCGVAVADAGQDIHRQYHAELTERIQAVSRMTVMMSVQLGLVPPDRKAEVIAGLAEWGKEGR